MTSDTGLQSYFWQERGHQVANLTSCCILRPSRLCDAMSLSIKFKFFMSLRQVNAVKAPVGYVFLLEERFG